MGEYASVTDPSDWRTPLLAGATELDVPVAARNPSAWPDHTPRRARAMIFAPRSWPSRPGLATTTRMRPGLVTRAS